MSKHNDRLALDKSSVRTIDQDGHLHVSASAISKANVCQYYGKEIPEFESLGLDPNKLYDLLRDPVALEKSAPTFNGKPLLTVHKPQTAADHDHELVAGSVSNVRWEAPYLIAALDIWDGAAIEAVQSGEQRELSCGYYYRAVMEPGENDGVKFDGRMVDIVGNHVTLVSEGRAGPDVFVGDRKTTKGNPIMKMRLTAPSRKAVLAAGALHTYLAPKLAADAKVDITGVLKGVTAATWKASKPKIKAALDKATKGKLAADADLEDVIEMLDQLDDVTDEMADTPLISGDDDNEEMDPAAMDDDMMAKVKEILGPDADEAKVKALCALMAAPAAKDAETVIPPKKDEPVKPEVTKAAMDAAIAAAATKAAKAAEESTMARMRAIQEAIEDVRPRIGKIGAQDSAEEVYRLALDGAGVDLTDVPPVAFRALFKALPPPGEVKQRGPAMDAKGDADFAKRFPGALTLKQR